MGLSCFEPRVAFYVFSNISGMGMTSEEFCHKAGSWKHVACVPGTAFVAAGEGFMRCSYASSMDNLEGSAEKESRSLWTNAENKTIGTGYRRNTDRGHGDETSRPGIWRRSSVRAAEFL